MYIVSFILSLGKMSGTVNTALITIIMSQFNTDGRGRKGLGEFDFSHLKQEWYFIGNLNSHLDQTNDILEPVIQCLLMHITSVLGRLVGSNTQTKVKLLACAQRPLLLLHSTYQTIKISYSWVWLCDQGISQGPWWFNACLPTSSMMAKVMPCG